MCGRIGELIIAKPIPIGICANSSSKPVSESSTPCLHELAILTGLNELEAAYTLAFIIHHLSSVAVREI